MADNKNILKQYSIVIGADTSEFLKQLNTLSEEAKKHLGDKDLGAGVKASLDKLAKNIEKVEKQVKESATDINNSISLISTEALKDEMNGLRTLISNDVESVRISINELSQALEVLNSSDMTNVSETVRKSMAAITNSVEGSMSKVMSEFKEFRQFITDFKAGAFSGTSNIVGALEGTVKNNGDLISKELDKKKEQLRGLLEAYGEIMFDLKSFQARQSDSLTENEFDKLSDHLSLLRNIQRTIDEIGSSNATNIFSEAVLNDNTFIDEKTIKSQVKMITEALNRTISEWKSENVGKEPDVYLRWKTVINPSETINELVEKIQAEADKEKNKIKLTVGIKNTKGEIKNLKKEIEQVVESATSVANKGGSPIKVDNPNNNANNQTQPSQQPSQTQPSNQAQNNTQPTQINEAVINPKGASIDLSNSTINVNTENLAQEKTLSDIKSILSGIKEGMPVNIASASIKETGNTTADDEQAAKKTRSIASLLLRAGIGRGTTKEKEMEARARNDQFVGLTWLQARKDKVLELKNALKDVKDLDKVEEIIKASALLTETFTTSDGKKYSKWANGGSPVTIEEFQKAFFDEIRKFNINNFLDEIGKTNKGKSHQKQRIASDTPYGATVNKLYDQAYATLDPNKAIEIIKNSAYFNDTVSKTYSKYVGKDQKIELPEFQKALKNDVFSDHLIKYLEKQLADKTNTSERTQVIDELLTQLRSETDLSKYLEIFNSSRFITETTTDSAGNISAKWAKSNSPLSLPDFKKQFRNEVIEDNLLPYLRQQIKTVSDTETQNAITALLESLKGSKKGKRIGILEDSDFYKGSFDIQYAKWSLNDTPVTIDDFQKDILTKINTQTKTLITNYFNKTTKDIEKAQKARVQNLETLGVEFDTKQKQLANYTAGKTYNGVGFNRKSRILSRSTVAMTEKDSMGQYYKQLSQLSKTYLDDTVDSNGNVISEGIENLVLQADLVKKQRELMQSIETLSIQKGNGQLSDADIQKLEDSKKELLELSKTPIDEKAETRLNELLNKKELFTNKQKNKSLTFDEARELREIEAEIPTLFKSIDGDIEEWVKDNSNKSLIESKLEEINQVIQDKRSQFYKETRRIRREMLGDQGGIRNDEELQQAIEELKSANSQINILRQSMNGYDTSTLLPEEQSLLRSLQGTVRRKSSEITNYMQYADLMSDIVLDSKAITKNTEKREKELSKIVELEEEIKQLTNGNTLADGVSSMNDDYLQFYRQKATEILDEEKQKKDIRIKGLAQKNYDDRISLLENHIINNNKEIAEIDKFLAQSIKEPQTEKLMKKIEGKKKEREKLENRNISDSAAIAQLKELRATANSTDEIIEKIKEENKLDDSQIEKLKKIFELTVNINHAKKRTEELELRATKAHVMQRDQEEYDALLKQKEENDASVLEATRIFNTNENYIKEMRKKRGALESSFYNENTRERFGKRHKEEIIAASEYSKTLTALEEKRDSILAEMAANIYVSDNYKKRLRDLGATFDSSSVEILKQMGLDIQNQVFNVSSYQPFKHNKNKFDISKINGSSDSAQILMKMNADIQKGTFDINKYIEDINTLLEKNKEREQILEDSQRDYSAYTKKNEELSTSLSQLDKQIVQQREIIKKNRAAIREKARFDRLEKEKGLLEHYEENRRLNLTQLFNNRERLRASNLSKEERERLIQESEQARNNATTSEERDRLEARIRNLQESDLSEKDKKRLIADNKILRQNAQNDKVEIRSQKGLIDRIQYMLDPKYDDQQLAQLSEYDENISRLSAQNDKIMRDILQPTAQKNAEVNHKLAQIEQKSAIRSVASNGKSSVDLVETQEQLIQLNMLRDELLSALSTVDMSRNTNVSQIIKHAIANIEERQLKKKAGDENVGDLKNNFETLLNAMFESDIYTKSIANAEENNSTLTSGTQFSAQTLISLIDNEINKRQSAIQVGQSGNNNIVSASTIGSDNVVKRTATELDNEIKSIDTQIQDNNQKADALNKQYEQAKANQEKVSKELEKYSKLERLDKEINERISQISTDVIDNRTQLETEIGNLTKERDRLARLEEARKRILQSGANESIGKNVEEELKQVTETLEQKSQQLEALNSKTPLQYALENSKVTELKTQYAEYAINETLSSRKKKYNNKENLDLLHFTDDDIEFFKSYNAFLKRQDAVTKQYGTTAQFIEGIDQTNAEKYQSAISFIENLNNLPVNIEKILTARENAKSNPKSVIEDAALFLKNGGTYDQLPKAIHSIIKNFVEETDTQIQNTVKTLEKEIGTIQISNTGLKNRRSEIRNQLFDINTTTWTTEELEKFFPITDSGRFANLKEAYQFAYTAKNSRDDKYKNEIYDNELYYNNQNKVSKGMNETQKYVSFMVDKILKAYIDNQNELSKITDTTSKEYKQRAEASLELQKWYELLVNEARELNLQHSAETKRVYLDESQSQRYLFGKKNDIISNIDKNVNAVKANDSDEELTDEKRRELRQAHSKESAKTKAALEKELELNQKITLEKYRSAELTREMVSALFEGNKAQKDHYVGMTEEERKLAQELYEANGVLMRMYSNKDTEENIKKQRELIASLHRQIEASDRLELYGKGYYKNAQLIQAFKDNPNLNYTTAIGGINSGVATEKTLSAIRAILENKFGKLPKNYYSSNGGSGGDGNGGNKKPRYKFDDVAKKVAKELGILQISKKGNEYVKRKDWHKLVDELIKRGIGTIKNGKNPNPPSGGKNGGSGSATQKSAKSSADKPKLGRRKMTNGQGYNWSEAYRIADENNISPTKTFDNGFRKYNFTAREAIFKIMEQQGIPVVIKKENKKTETFNKDAYNKIGQELGFVVKKTKSGYESLKNSNGGNLTSEERQSIYAEMEKRKVPKYIPTSVHSDEFDTELYKQIAQEKNWMYTRKNGTQCIDKTKIKDIYLEMEKRKPGSTKQSPEYLEYLRTGQYTPSSSEQTKESKIQTNAEEKKTEQVKEQVKLEEKKTEQVKEQVKSEEKKTEKTKQQTGSQPQQSRTFSDEELALAQELGPRITNKGKSVHKGDWNKLDAKLAERKATSSEDNETLLANAWDKLISQLGTISSLDNVSSFLQTNKAEPLINAFEQVLGFANKTGLKFEDIKDKLSNGFHESWIKNAQNQSLIQLLEYYNQNKELPSDLKSFIELNTRNNSLLTERESLYNALVTKEYKDESKGWLFDSEEQGIPRLEELDDEIIKIRNEADNTKVALARMIELPKFISSTTAQTPEKSSKFSSLREQYNPDKLYADMVDIVNTKTNKNGILPREDRAIFDNIANTAETYCNELIKLYAENDIALSNLDKTSEKYASKLKEQKDITKDLYKLGYRIEDNGWKKLRSVNEYIDKSIEDIVNKIKTLMQINPKHRDVLQLASLTDALNYNGYDYLPETGELIKHSTTSTFAPKTEQNDNNSAGNIIENIDKVSSALKESKDTKQLDKIMSVTSPLRKLKESITEEMSDKDKAIRLADTLFALDNADMSKIPDSIKVQISSIKDYVISEMERLKAEYVDLTGQMFDVGLPTSVINNESSITDENKLGIKQMAKPIIKQNGSVIRYGQVILDDLDKVKQSNQLNVSDQAKANIDKYGKDTVQAWINGAKAETPEMEQAFLEIANIPKDVYKKVLDINSPSEVMKQLGFWTIAGLTEGMEEHVYKVDGVAYKLATGITENFTAILGKVTNAIAANTIDLTELLDLPKFLSQFKSDDFDTLINFLTDQTMVEQMTLLNEQFRQLPQLDQLPQTQDKTLSDELTNMFMVDGKSINQNTAAAYIKNNAQEVANAIDSYIAQVKEAGDDITVDDVFEQIFGKKHKTVSTAYEKAIKSLKTVIEETKETVQEAETEIKEAQQVVEKAQDSKQPSLQMREETDEEKDKGKKKTDSTKKDQQKARKTRNKRITQETTSEPDDDSKRKILYNYGTRQTYNITDPITGKSKTVGAYSFVEELQNGQTKRVLSVYNEQTQKWEESTLSLKSNFQSVENQIIALDNQINKCTFDMEKARRLSEYYDDTGARAEIEVLTEKRGILLEILKAYDKEKQYNYNISSFEDTRAQNFERLEAANYKDIEKVNSQRIDNFESKVEEFYKTLSKLYSLQSKDLKGDKNKDQIAETEKELNELRGTIKTIYTELSQTIDMSSQLGTRLKNIRNEYVGKAYSLSLGAPVSDARRSMTDEYKNMLQKTIDKNAHHAETYDNRYSGGKFKEYETRIRNYQYEIASLKTYLQSLQNIDIITKDQYDEAERMVNNIIQAKKKIDELPREERGYSLKDQTSYLERINKLLYQNSGMSEEAKEQIKGYYNEMKDAPTRPLEQIWQAIQNIYVAEVKAGRAGKSFFDIVQDKLRYGIAQQFSMYFSLYDIIRYLRQGFETIRELDTALTEMRKVSDETTESLKRFQVQSFDTAKQVGSTASVIQNSAADWMRLGELTIYNCTPLLCRNT